MKIALLLSNESDLLEAMNNIIKNDLLMDRIKNINIETEKETGRSFINIEAVDNIDVSYLSKLEKELKKCLVDVLQINSLFINTTIKQKNPNGFFANNYDLILYYW